jgi:hypothetical protein
MVAVLHGVSHDLVPNDVEPAGPQHLQVGVGIEVAPEHVRSEPALRIVVLGEVASAEAQQRDTTRSKHAAELREDAAVVGTRYVDHRVVGDEAIEAAITERQRREISLCELRPGDARSRERELRARDVDPDDAQVGVGQQLHHRDPGAAPGVEHRVSGTQARHDLGEKVDVAAPGAGGKVPVGDLVVAAADYAAGVLHSPSIQCGAASVRSISAVTSPVEVCAECGFDGSAWTDADAITAISVMPARWSDAVAGLADSDLQRRPIPAMWSIAEYVDHVREVLFGMRFLVDTLINDPGTDLGDSPDPAFEPEPRVIDVDLALAGLSREAAQLVDALTVAPPQSWTNTVTVSGDELDLHWIARHGVHDPTHHLRDVARLRASL